jgi:hypothetical protein
MSRIADDFWDENSRRTGPPLTDALLREFEERYRRQLPEAYVRLLRRRNGGRPRRCYFPIRGLVGWGGSYLGVDFIRGVFKGYGGIEDNDGGDNYPRIGLIIGDTPSGGHDFVMLDYDTPGPTGEPRVVHAVQGDGSEDVTQLAPDFETFVRMLVAERPDDEEGE